MDRTQIDTVIEARWIIPAEPNGLILENHAIAIDKGVIQAVQPILEINLQFSPIERIILPQHALIPGLINLHTSGAMALMRGIAGNLPLGSCHNNYISSAETRHLSSDFVLDGTRLACIEMLRGGITCFNDMYFFPEESAKAVLASGMRGVIGMVASDFPTAYASDVDDYIAKGLAVRDEYRHHSLLSFCFSPPSPNTLSDKALTKILTYAEQLDLPIHTYLHETEAGIKYSLKNFDMRPLSRLHKLGLLSPSFIGVKMNYLTEKEIQLTGAQGCNVVYCPSSSLRSIDKLSSISIFLKHGVNVGLGTGNAAYNNRLDMFEAMRLVALLAKGKDSVTNLSAHQILQMATINSAKALGLEDRIGSLVKGKMADITAIDFSAPELLPCYDPVSHVVCSSGRENVSHLWVGGKMLLKEKKLTSFDEDDILARVHFWENRIKINKDG